jgi:hypothetical protein
MRITNTEQWMAAYQNLIVQPLWDSQPLGSVTAIPARVPFFSNTFLTVYNVAKNDLDVNMPSGGKFPSPDSYYITGVMFHPVARSPANAAFALTDLTDFSRVMDQGLLTVTIGSAQSSLVQGHPMLFPSGLGLQGMVTTGGATTGNVAHIIGNGVRDIQNAFGFTGAFAEGLGPNEQMNCALTWPAGVPSISNTFTARVYLRGIWGQGVR